MVRKINKKRYKFLTNGEHVVEAHESRHGSEMVLVEKILCHIVVEISHKGHLRMGGYVWMVS